MRQTLQLACLCLFLNVFTTASAQEMKFDWSRSYATVSNNPVNIATDSKNGIYTTAGFTGTIQAGSLSFNSAGEADIILTKHDSSGALIWAKAFGGSGADQVNDITIDKNSDVFIAGFFNGSISFDAITLTSAGSGDGFLVKLNSGGAVVWARKIGGNDADDVKVIECYNDNIFIGGNYASTNLDIDGTVLAKTHAFHGYYAKLNQSGNAIWAKKGSSNLLGGIGGFQFSDIKVIDDNTADLFGFLLSDVIFNPPSPGLLAGAFPRIFQLRVNSGDGSFINHAFSGIDSRTLGAGKVAINSRKATVSTGSSRTLSISPMVVRGFLSRRDSAGNLLSPVHFTEDVTGQPNGSSTAYTTDVAYVQDTSVLATGVHIGPTSFGGGFISPSSNQTGQAAFLWGTDTNLISRRMLTPGSKTDFSSSFSGLAVDTLKNVAYAAGYFSGSGTAFIIGSDTLTNNPGQLNLLISKIYLNAPAPALLTVAVSNDTTICRNGSATLSATASGGTPGYTYSWSPTTGLQNPYAATTTASPTSNTIYTLTVKDASLGRVASDVVNVAVMAAPTPTITASGPLALCTGGSVTLTSSVASSYSWNTGATTASITVSAAGNYSLTTTNSMGCPSAPATVLVTVTAVPAQPVITASGALQFCEGGSVTLTAPVANSYSWSNGASTQSITVNASGNYTVIVSSAPGCSSIASAPAAVTVWTRPVKPVVTAAGATQFCEGGTVQLASTGSTGYLWSNGATTQNINVNTAGNYTVTVVNMEGCSSLPSDPVAVTVWAKPAQPTITASGATQFCEGGNVTLASSSGTTYLWSNGATTQNINVNAAGNYSVVVTNAQGCSSVASAATVVTVNAKPAQPVIAASGPLSFCEGANVVLTSTTANAYSWSNAAATASITVAAAGNFSVTVTNAQGCSSVASAVSTTSVNALPPVPVITRSGNILTSSAASGNQWYFEGVAIPGATSGMVSIGGFGAYTVRVTNASGCSSMSAVFNVDNFTGNRIVLRNGDEFIYLIKPNPATTQASLDFLLASSSKVSISLMSEKGNKVVTALTPRQLAAGPNTVRLDSYINQLPSGIYFVVYTINDEKVVDRLMIVK
ncbi:MAG: T9SS type A sorting domain-containing protein [Sphingobacteriaceae bacterium]|nr:MAG: T9SS type A sorting domain-containing protein [Sphingobacteriaceae bacterium]